MEALTKELIKQYYAMDDDQRAFILKVIELNPTWQKYDFMKALMLFNKARDIGCGVSDEKLNEFIKLLDERSTDLNYWLRRNDGEFRKEIGY